MTNRINGVTGPTVTSAERSPAKGRESVARDGTSPRGAADGVSLTQAAQEVRAATASLASVPVVNQAKVEEVRLALERGEYRPDPAAIAGRLLDVEDQV
ncbi:MAG: flagellar biosynthesis anti-sigma factor FlgM [Steroidobacteraceae bacterium]